MGGLGLPSKSRRLATVGFVSANFDEAFLIKNSFFRPTAERYGRENCPKMVTFPAVVRFETEDESFAEDVPVTVVRWEDGLTQWRGSIDWNEIQGRYRPEPDPDYELVGIEFHGQKMEGSSFRGWVYEVVADKSFRRLLLTTAAEWSSTTLD